MERKGPARANRPRSHPAPQLNSRNRVAAPEDPDFICPIRLLERSDQVSGGKIATVELEPRSRV